jgi:hypothetical protein
MKTKKLLFFIFFFILVNCSLIFAQWESDVRLTNNSSMSWTTNLNTKCIAAGAGGLLHVVWRDHRDGNAEIYYKRSTDGGTVWEQDVRLTNNSSSSSSPSVSAYGNFVHVVWVDNRDGNNEIYYKRSTNGGLNWENDFRLTNDGANSEYPLVDASGLNVNIVWTDERDGNREIYFKRSTNSGANWENDVRLTFDVSLSRNPFVSIYNNFVNVSWWDNRDGNAEIYYKRSTNNGLTWENDFRLTFENNTSRYPVISAFASYVYVAWTDFRDGNYEIYFKYSTNNGINWSSDTRITNNTANSDFAYLCASGSNVHLLWIDNRDGNDEIYYKRSTSNGVSWEPDTRLTNNTASSYGESIAVYDTVVNVVWTDNRDGGDGEIYYKRNRTANVTGIIRYENVVNEFQLYQNYPNPFNSSTTIKFNLPLRRRVGGMMVLLKIYDISGKEILSLINENLEPGTYKISFNAINLPSGVYYYKLQSVDFSKTRKLVISK